jgi:hypothetical protein
METCPEGQTGLEDYAECLSWAVKLGKADFKSDPPSIASTPDDDRPYGCIYFFVEGEEDVFLWNEPTIGSPAINCAPVCKFIGEDDISVMP